MSALIGFWHELAVLVPEHEKDKVLPLAEENSPPPTAVVLGHL